MTKQFKKKSNKHASSVSPLSSPTTPLSNRHPSSSGLWLLILLILIGIGGLIGIVLFLGYQRHQGSSLSFNKSTVEPPNTGTNLNTYQESQKIVPSHVESQPSPQSTSGIFLNPQKPPSYQVGVLATKGHVSHMMVAPDGSVIVCGGLKAGAQLPKGVSPVFLTGNTIDEGSSFIIRLQPDLKGIMWVAIFGGDTFYPSHLGILRGGLIVVGGTIGKNYAVIPQLAQQSFSKTSTALLGISAKVPSIIWARPGSPNQTKISGLAVDTQNLIYWTGDTNARGAANYVQRITDKGLDQPFPAVPTKEGIKESWAIYLHPSEWQLNQPGQYMSFYNKARESSDGYYDYDGPGKWEAVRWNIHGMREGGQIVFLPNGDFVVTADLQYDFRVKDKKWEPCFDAFIARYRPDGKLIWSTNLYRAGDSVHTPDQKPWALTYDSASDSIIAVFGQHGSNVYRFYSPHADLRGDSGNMYMAWVGKINAQTGELQTGWYYQTSYQGKYDENGLPKPPPHPKLSGNRIYDCITDTQGFVYLVGVGGAKAWTSPHAIVSWPEDQSGGGHGVLIVLDPQLNCRYLTLISSGLNGAGSTLTAIRQHKQGILVAGKAGIMKKLSENHFSWSSIRETSEEAPFLVKLEW